MRRTLLFSVIALLAFAVYGNTLSGGFLGDDYSLLALFHQSTTEAQTESPQWEVVEAAFVQKVPEAQVPKYYRPLWFLSLYLDARLFGTWSPGFRIHNLLLFALSAFFLAGFVEALTGRRFAAIAAALLFVVFPTNYASVQWIADRTGQLAVCFSTASLWLFVLYLRGARPRHGVLAFLTCLLALLSKETALILFPLLLVLGIVLVAQKDSRQRSRLWWSLLPVLLLAWFVWRHHILGTWLGGARDPGHYTLLDMAWNQFGVALSLLVPIRWPDMGPGFFWPFVLLFSTLIGVGLYLGRRAAPWLLFFLLWFVLSLLPNALDSSLPGSQRNLRFTFPSALPFVVLVILALQAWCARWSSRLPWLRKALVGGLLLGSLGLLIHNRRSWVEAGRSSPEIVDRVLTLARTGSDKGVLVYGLPAWHGNAPLMLNAFPFLLRRPFLAQPRRPFLAYADGDLGQLGLLRDAPHFLRGGSYSALRWDPRRQALIPAALPRYEERRGRLVRGPEGGLFLEPLSPAASPQAGGRKLRERFSRQPLRDLVGVPVQIRGLSVQTERGAELLIAELRRP